MRKDTSDTMEKTREMDIRPNGTLRSVTVNTEDSRTHQEFKEQCDVNNILRTYRATGQITHVNHKQMLNLPGQVLDVTQYPDYQTSLQTVLDARDAFMQLPSQLRKKFGNDPQNLVEYLSDEKNREEAEKLGLVTKREAPVQTAQSGDTKTKTKTKTVDVSEKDTSET